LLQIIDPTGVVDDGAVFYLVEEAVNSQVTPKGIIGRTAVGIVGCQDIIPGTLADPV
jgi:hypothetical protein